MRTGVRSAQGMSRKIRVLSWAIALCGLWEFGDVVAPFVPGFGVVPAFVWNHIVTGLVLIVAGAWAALTHSARTARRLALVAAAGGLWLIVAPLLLGPPEVAAGLWNDIVVGTLVVVLATAAAVRLKVGQGEEVKG